MKTVLSWIEKHPLILSLVLIGGISGGISTLSGTTTYVIEWFSPPTQERYDEPEKLDPFGRPIVSGRICPFLYESTCVDDNKSTISKIRSNGGNVIALELQIDWSVDALDARWEMCSDGEALSDTPINLDHAEPGFVVFDVPIDPNSCAQSEFMGLPSEVLGKGVVQENAGNIEYLILGTYYVGWGELFNDTLPTVAYPGWIKLDVFPKN